MRSIIAIFIALFACAGAVFAADQSAVSNCKIIEEAEGNSAECDFRLTLPGQVSQAGILANGEELADPSFTAFEDGNGKAAWFFLIDRSNPRRAGTVKRSVELVKRLYARANAKNIMSVGTFAEDLRVIISPGDPYADLDTRLAEIKADGAATAFFFTGIQAIDILKKVPADRRALVIISDGKAEDTAYTRDDVVKHAREAGVVIYGVGFAEKASETVDLQEVERLASETGGPFFSAVGSNPLPPAFFSDFTRYLTGGGHVAAPLGARNGEISLRPQIVLQSGATIKGNSSNAYIEPPELPPPPPPPLIAKIYAILDPAFPGASAWAAESQATAWILLILFPLLILIALGIYWLRRPSTGGGEFYEPQDEEEPPLTQPIPADGMTFSSGHSDELFGYFEPLDSNQQRYAIREQNVTIGRHSENDFQLDDDSVHRHHAVFHISPEREPVITDLDTVNGVIVNGSRVPKAVLNDGDVIELGAARFRFLAA